MVYYYPRIKVNIVLVIIDEAREINQTNNSVCQQKKRKNSYQKIFRRRQFFIQCRDELHYDCSEMIKIKIITKLLCNDL